MIDVDDVPEPQGEPAGEERTDIPDAGASAGPTKVVSADPRWTEDDLKLLITYIQAGHSMYGMRIGGDAGPRIDPSDAENTLPGWFEVSDIEAKAIALPMTWWMPVSWVRGGAKGSPILGVIGTVAALWVVTGPRVERANALRRERDGERAQVRDVGGDRPLRGAGGAARVDEPRTPGRDGQGGDRRGDQGAAGDGAGAVPPAGKARRGSAAIEYLRARGGAG